MRGTCVHCSFYHLSVLCSVSYLKNKTKQDLMSEVLGWIHSRGEYQNQNKKNQMAVCDRMKAYYFTLNLLLF